jgi:Na+/proline symporter
MVIISRQSDHFKPVQMIASLGFLAIAFSSQLLPVTFDMLYIRRGTRAGAIGGMLVGLAIVFLFTPFFSIFADTLPDRERLQGLLGTARKMIDIGAWGLIGNVTVFVLVSLVTRRPDAERVAEFARIMKGKSA